MNDTEKAIKSLKDEMENREKRTILNFKEFLEDVRKEPERVLRNIFQLFPDMVESYVGQGIDEYPNDPQSVGFVKYDCSKIFVEGADNPFFADRLFANRFIRQIKNLKQGSQQNKIYIYEGPSGCGKSVFLNNLLRTFEEYTKTEEGRSFEIFWQIEVGDHKVEFSCPNHDHPILIIPKRKRIEFLDKLLSVSEVRDKLCNEKEYEWVFREEVCTVCKSLFWALFDKLDSFDQVLSMVKVRLREFDRRLGEGISIFNPGDRPMKETYLSDEEIQGRLDQIFGANLVKYIFSQHAKTNNGIYVLMDIKSHNKERLLALHNLISEGVHKVNGIIEERINSLFLALMNPEDMKIIEGEKERSFQGRIQHNKMSYVLEPPTEVKVYRSIFGEYIDSRFLPGVLENFARVIISSRMNTDCSSLEEWIGHMERYENYCDEYGILLRMEIYSGIIPPWLSEGDKKNFTAEVRKKLIAEGENEGNKGVSGRDSIRLFSDFFSAYGMKPDLINMNNVVEYFNQCSENVPSNFINSLVDWYDYTVLNEVKEALYFYNKEQISEDILNFLYAINYNIGDKVKCKFTNKEIEVTIEFFKMVGRYIAGYEMSNSLVTKFVQDVQQRYARAIAQYQGPITEMELYQEFFNSYIRNSKEKVLHPFLENKNFREAIKSFGAKEFKVFDVRLGEHIEFMISNLVNKFGYTEQGAKEICLYIIDKKLVEKFSK